jgi:hypothetical protein
MKKSLQAVKKLRIELRLLSTYIYPGYKAPFHQLYLSGQKLVQGPTVLCKSGEHWQGAQHLSYCK